MLDKLWSGSAQKKQEAARSLFVAEHAAWVNRVAAVKTSNESIYSSNLREFEEWERRRAEYEEARNGHNAAVERRQAAYEALQPEAISDYCEMVLAESEYPDFCPKQSEVGYHAGSKTLIVEYELPPPDDVPRLAEVKFVRSKGDFAETELTRKQFETLYGDLLMALVTDSTRFVTLHITGNAVNGIEGVDESYHTLSHHGLDDEKLRQLTIVEQSAVNEWGNFLRKLKADGLLDETMVLLTSNLGNASSHDNRNMPVLFAGGGFRHGQHLAFDQKNNYPLPNLYLSALHRLGLQQEKFATSTGELSELAV